MERALSGEKRWSECCVGRSYYQIENVVFVVGWKVYLFI